MPQPSWTDEESAQPQPPPAVELRLQYNFAVRGVRFFESASLRVQTLQVMVDTLLMRSLLLFLYALYADLAQIAAHLASALLPAIGLMPPETTTERKPKLYFRWLNIQPLRILISCRSVAGGIGLNQMLTHDAPQGALALLNSVGALLSNVDRAPIKLNSLVLENLFAPAERIGSSIGAGYKEQVLSQLYKVLLSFEVRPPLRQRHREHAQKPLADPAT